jgi:hypothetical protein
VSDDIITLADADMAGYMAVDDVTFVKELYPRLKPNDAAIERYRAAIDLLPPIAVARGRILVDGFHRWQAYRREGIAEIPAIDLGALSDIEIKKESYRRNKAHGHQLEASDKKRGADDLYRSGITDMDELCDLLGITPATAETYLRDAKRDEKRQQQERALDLFLDCVDNFTEIARIATGDADRADTVKRWISSAFSDRSDFAEPPESRQHFDVWQFPTTDRDAGGQQSYFGAVPPQVMENLLWFYTDPGDVVVDLFAGSGTTVDVAKTMGRRVWAADIRGNHYSPHLPIHQHDATEGWPDDAPRKAKLVFLDPPYWRQAAGRYSSEPGELAEMDLDAFYAAWWKVAKAAMDHAERVAYIISPTQREDGSVIDHATDMVRAFSAEGWTVERRIIVPYSTQQATGQQVTWARENRRMLKLYRDLVVLTP